MADTVRHDPASAVLIGGHAALDFANTVGWHASEQPRERIADYGDFIRWARRAGLLSEPECAALERAAGAARDAAEQVRGRAVGLREALYRVAAAAAARGVAPADDLALINAARVDALAHARLVQTADGFVVVWALDTPVALELPLWRVAHAIGELLTSDAIGRLRQCEGHPCGWLFLDRSRNRSRRWCSSADCGNRVRVREHQARRRNGRGIAP